MKKACQHLISRKLEVRFDVTKDRCQCTDFQRIMRGDGDVMFAVLKGCQAYMATGLAGNMVSEFGKRFCKLDSVDVAGKFQTAMTSS